MVFELQNSKKEIETLTLEIESIKSKIKKAEESYFEKRKREELEIMQQNKENNP